MGCSNSNCHLVHIRPQNSYMDSHCHLDLLQGKYHISASNFDYPSKYKGCITNFVFPSYYSCLDDILNQDKVWGTLGLHPKFAYMLPEVKSFLCKRSEKTDIIAIGETGLDSKTDCPFSVQMEAFQFQMELSKKLQKPLVIHCRGYSDEVLRGCKQLLPSMHKIHLHCFSGEVKEMEEWCSYFPSLKVGVTNLINNDSAVEAFKIVKNIPLERLLLETDAPHFVPRSHHSTLPNFSHPGLALNVAVRVAQLRSLPLRTVLKSSFDNTKELYNIDL